MRNPAAICLATLLLPTLSMAQNQIDWSDWTMGARHTVQIGVFHPALDTQLRIDSSDGTPGTPVDFEQNLGMSDTETLPTFMYQWRVAKRHRLSLEYYQLDRSGSAVTGTITRFGDKEFEVNLPISSFMDTDVATVAYSYSILFDERREFAISAGLTRMDVRFGIVGNGSQGVIEAETDLIAPLPAIGLDGGYAFTDKLFLRVGVGVFSFDLSLSNDKDLRGSMTTAMAGVYHNTFKHVRFGLTFNYFDVDVDWGNASGFNSFQYTYQGPTLSMAATF